MIHVAMPALNSTLVNLGLSRVLTDRVEMTIGMLTLDPVVCPFHTPLEDKLLLLIENTTLYQQGLVSIDDVIAAARALSSVLMEVAARYIVCNNIPRADLVIELSRAMGESFKWRDTDAELTVEKKNMLFDSS